MTKSNLQQLDYLPSSMEVPKAHDLPPPRKVITKRVINAILDYFSRQIYRNPEKTFALDISLDLSLPDFSKMTSRAIVQTFHANPSNTLSDIQLAQISGSYKTILCTLFETLPKDLFDINPGFSEVFSGIDIGQVDNQGCIHVSTYKAESHNDEIRPEEAAHALLQLRGSTMSMR